MTGELSAEALRVATREQLDAMMSDAERAAWQRLPDEVTAYRGAHRRPLVGVEWVLDPAAAAAGWSDSREAANHPGPMLVRAVIEKARAAVKLTEAAHLITGEPREPAVVAWAPIGDPAEVLSRFDPWLASEAQLHAASAAWEALAGTIADRHGPMHRLGAARSAIKHREAIERGDGRAMMEALAALLEAGMPAPDWLTSRFVAAVERVTRHEAASWDGALGPARPKNEHLGTARLRHRAEVRLALLFGAGGVPRTREGFERAARILRLDPALSELTARQVEQWSPRVRRNARKPPAAKRAGMHSAADPFGLIRRRR